MARYKIRFERLIIAILLLFLIVDTVPHPALSDGILQRLVSKEEVDTY